MVMVLCVAAVVGCVPFKQAKPDVKSGILKETKSASMTIKPMHKTSSKTIHVAAEVKAYYVRLMEKNPELKERFDELIAEAREEYGPHLSIGEPTVVDWFPSESHRHESATETENVFEETVEDSGCFLVIQSVGWARPRHEGCDTMIVAKFQTKCTRVTLSDESKIDDPNVKHTNQLTIQFMGLMDPNLASLKRKQN